MKKIKTLIQKIFIVLIDLGIDFRKIYSLCYFPLYFIQYKKYKKLGGGVTHFRPVLTNYYQEAGQTRGHYFHQDLLVARFIYEKSPVRHIDIGSRVDGFVAHVASYRPIEVIDIRDLKNIGHKNITFIKADLMSSVNLKLGNADSISCLHAIEHFGLGRYGDPIDPNGHIKGFRNLIEILAAGGFLYISFPIGVQNEVHFNAHRVFHPLDIFNWIIQKNDLLLDRFDYVDDEGNLFQDVDLFNMQIYPRHGCGIYTFKKIN